MIPLNHKETVEVVEKLFSTLQCCTNFNFERFICHWNVKTDIKQETFLNISVTFDLNICNRLPTRSQIRKDSVVVAFWVWVSISKYFVTHNYPPCEWNYILPKMHICSLNKRLKISIIKVYTSLHVKATFALWHFEY